jgi:hypothetical protein
VNLNFKFNLSSRGGALLTRGGAKADSYVHAGTLAANKDARQAEPTRALTHTKEVSREHHIPTPG